MTEEILINVTPREARVGVVENGMLQEVHVERSGHRGYVGNIYEARILGDAGEVLVLGDLADADDGNRVGLGHGRDPLV